MILQKFPIFGLIRHWNKSHHEKCSYFLLLKCLFESGTKSKQIKALHLKLQTYQSLLHMSHVIPVRVSFDKFNKFSCCCIFKYNAKLQNKGLTVSWPIQFSQNDVREHFKPSKVIKVCASKITWRYYQGLSSRILQLSRSSQTYLLLQEISLDALLLPTDTRPNDVI